MTPANAVFALAALFPAMGNPQPSVTAAPTALALALCGGASMVIPLTGGEPARSATPCCQKGCHADRKRRRSETEPFRPQGAP